MRINIDTGVDINTNINITASYNALNLNIFLKFLRNMSWLKAVRKFWGRRSKSPGNLRNVQKSIMKNYQCYFFAASADFVHR